MLLLSLKKLVDEKPIKSVRLWGKVFGTQSNYIIVEGELREGSPDDEDAIVNPKAEEVAKTDSEPAEAAEPTEAKNPEEDESDAPKPKQKPAAVYPTEQRAGVNKYVYYVCSYGTVRIV